jgi:hypothetical protein
MVDEVVVEEVALECVVAKAEVVLGEEASTCSTKEWMLARVRQHCLQVRRLMIFTESVCVW